MRVAVLYATQTGKAIHVSRIIQRAIVFGYHPQTLYNLDRQTRKHDVVVCDINSVRVQTRESHVEIAFYNLLEIKWNLASDSIAKLHDRADLGEGISSRRESVRLCFDFVVFVVSTHGDGTHPYSLSHFWKNFVPIPNFAVFGLGDSSYDRFNYCSKRLFNRLRMGGGVGFRRGEGDEQDAEGLYTGLRAWLGDLCAYIDEMECKAHASARETNDCGPQKQSDGSEHVQAATFDTGSDGLSCQEETEKMYQSVELVSKVLLTPEGYDRPVLELSFKIERPCETISVTPENGNVEEFEGFLGVRSDWLRVLDFNRGPCQQVFLHLHRFMKQKYVDSNGKECPHRTAKKDGTTTRSSSSAGPHTGNDAQRGEGAGSALRGKTILAGTGAGPSLPLASCKVPLSVLLARLWDIGTDYSLYYNYVVKRWRSFYRILMELDIRVDVQFLLENLSLIHPRYYTAISTGRGTCTIVVVLQKNGLCSQYFESMAPGQRLRVGFYRRHVVIAERTCFVCTGTGISVPLSVLFENTNDGADRAALPSTMNTSEERNRALFLAINPRLKLPIVIYGFRYKDKDFLYRNVLETLAAEGRIVLHTAVSRENREYVQDILARLDVRHYEVVVSGNAVLNKHSVQARLLGKRHTHTAHLYCSEKNMHETSRSGPPNTISLSPFSVVPGDGSSPPPSGEDWSPSEGSPPEDALLSAEAWSPEEVLLPEDALLSAEVWSPEKVLLPEDALLSSEGWSPEEVLLPENVLLPVEDLSAEELMLPAEESLLLPLLLLSAPEPLPVLPVSFPWQPI
ncbi:UNVERIFIED_CONTAM: hypothetical protein PYX00_011818 [Menopon gallinae]|uniref:Flavodoxin-like domain-containing protein n=1 Tax=Menopon gallinae TaxID=328185 RepID=A0AAW2H8I6_9NEOP